MPIYEEKIVSPLAIRFTQDHIRTTFRDGRYVEAAIDEIRIREGFGDYDVILHAPFPPIEILRWSVPRQDADVQAEMNCPVGVRPREHWFTLDNRRLYCLQRVASAHWPKRVAAVVAIMYADPGTVRKKFDSTSFGWSVCIGHSYEELPIARWDWREKVLPLEVAAINEAHGVLEATLHDDRKRTVDALLDASMANGNHAAGAQGSAGSAASRKAAAAVVGKPRCPTPSTNDVSEPDDKVSESGGAASLAESRARATADAYDPAVANAVREIKQQISASNGRVDLQLWKERYEPKLGPIKDFVQSRPDKFCLIPGEGDDFKVVKARKRDQADAEDRATADLVAQALREIEEQLSVANNDGRLSLPHWKEQYEASLGSIRSFVKRWPDKFVVVAGEGKHFRAARLCDSAALHAIRDIEKQLESADFDGRLDLPRWKELFQSELGTLEDFLRSREGKFTMVPDGAGGFRVRRTRDAMSEKAIAEIEEQVDAPDHDGELRMPHWTDVYAPFLGTLRTFVESWPHRFTVVAGPDREFSVFKCNDDIEAQALQEIEEQIADPRHDGRVRVSRWNERYKASLGSLRGLVERFPERWKVIPGPGGSNKFIVTRTADLLAVKALYRVDLQYESYPEFETLWLPEWEEDFASVLGPLLPFLQRWPTHFATWPTTTGRQQVARAVDVLQLQAMAEIDAQLDALGGHGHVRIANWVQKYAPSLRSLRSFVESLPGRFTVIPEQGSSFAVARVQVEVVNAAVTEIRELFKAPDYDGFVQIADWSERYGPFVGTLRQFFHSHPDKFKITYVGNIMYAYPTACDEPLQLSAPKVMYLDDDSRRHGPYASELVPNRRWVPVGAPSGKR